MLLQNCTEQQLQQALTLTNKKYNNNLEFTYLTHKGKQLQFTIRVKTSHGKGARLGQMINSNGNRRHLINACWHAHGDLFDNILKINPEAIIKPAGKTIFKNKNGTTIGNWEDRNIGSMMEPLYYSEACEC